MNVNYLKRYIISSYVLVWALIIFVAAPASLVFKVPPVIMWIVRNIVAWSPSYLLLFGCGVSLLKCRYSHCYLHLVLHLGSVFYHSSSTHL